MGTRPEQIGKAFTLLKSCRAPETVLMLARAVGRADEDITITALSAADPASVDMRTLVLIGSSATRIIDRADGRPWVYTPRFVSEA